MKNSQKFLLVFALNLLIAAGFYIEHKNAGFTSLVSDVHSIIGIAEKFDDPEIFKDDLFLNSLDNVKYYTPFFVQPLRFIANFTNHNYVDALNVMSLFLHVAYGFLWFLLFYKLSRNFWLSVIISILIRGIIWLPGYEIWGITGVWTTMPRTVYIVFMPIFLLVLFHFKEKKLWLSAFLAGLIFNFHPITGLGGIIIYLSIIGYFYFVGKRKIKNPIQKLLIVFLSIVLGMLPFILTYFGKTSSVIDYDLATYQKALDARLPSAFFDPLSYLKKWWRTSTLFFIIPLLLYFIISFFRRSEYYKASLLIILTLILLIVPNFAVYLENMINTVFNRNFRISFQFIRLQKLAILPGYFALMFLILLLKPKRYVLAVIVGVFLFVVSISNNRIFNGVPLVGDDIVRTILPNSLNIYDRPSRENVDMEKMLAFIRKNTSKKAVFFGPEIIRSATKRSVVLDSKGASAIIEGNPEQFTNWFLEKKHFDALTSQTDKIQFLKDKNVTHIVEKGDKFDSLVPIKTINNLKLYKL